jgi:hypothetical protein
LKLTLNSHVARKSKLANADRDRERERETERERERQRENESHNCFSDPSSNAIHVSERTILNIPGPADAKLRR